MTDSTTFQIEGFEIAYKTWGDVKNPLVLAFHGWLDNVDSFQKIAPEISKRFYIIAFDLAGHGFSDHRSLHESYYLWDYAIDILRIIEQQNWKRFSILAHSMGTGVATLLAAIKPSFIEKLVFIDGLGPPFVTQDEQIVTHFQRSFRQLEMAKKMKLNGFSDRHTAMFKTKEEAIENRMKSTISPMPYASSKIIVERSLLSVKNGFRWRFDPRLVIPECFQITEKQSRIFLQALRCETLIILGENGLFHQSAKLERIHCIQRVQTQWLKGGHHLHLEEASTDIEKLIIQFI